MKIIVNIILTLLLFHHVSFSQRNENSKTVLSRNKVKTQLEKTCNGSCSAQHSTFDRIGNLIAWDFYRTGTRYQYIYDEDNNQIMTLWIDKNDPTKIDTIYPRQNQFDEKSEEEPFFETYFNNGQQFVKYRAGDVRIFNYDSNCLLVEKKHIENGILIYDEKTIYDKESRIVENRIVRSRRLEYLNASRNEEDRITEFIDRFVYNSKGQIVELYTYFSDPCMGIDGHFLYVYHYHENGLIESAEAYENGLDFNFSLEYEYEFFE